MPARKTRLDKDAKQLWEQYTPREEVYAEGTKVFWETKKSKFEEDLLSADSDLDKTISTARRHTDQLKAKIQIEIDKCQEVLDEIAK